MVTDSDRQIDIGDGIEIPEVVRGYVTYPDAGYEARITAIYDSRTGRYRTRELTIQAADGQEVTGELLRTVRVADLLRDAVNRPLAERLWPVIAGGPGANFADEGPTTRTLTYVALVYRLAVLVGDPATLSVADRLRVSRSTASNWVTRARDRGLLAVTDPRSSRGGSPVTTPSE